jgi:hypothetical protein
MSLQFYWVDDQRDKFQAVKNPVERPRGKKTKQAEVEFLDASQNEDLLVLIAQWAAKPKPDLIMLDHVFSKTGRKNLYRIAGSTVAHILRRTWSDVPMVCVTGMLENPSLRKKHSDRDSENQYLELFQYETLLARVDELYVIANDFKKVVKANLSSGNDVAKFLNVPANDKNIFVSSLPYEFQLSADASTPHRISRWILQVLMHYPGFLYSELRTATMLGLSLEGFTKVKDEFKAAAYKGPFAKKDNPLWWVDRVREILFKKVSAEAPSYSWLAGRFLKGIGPGDYSVCHINKEKRDIPDTVAQLYPRGGEVPVCSKYTTSHPHAITPAGFEELKIIKES